MTVKNLTRRTNEQVEIDSNGCLVPRKEERRHQQVTSVSETRKF